SVGARKAPFLGLACETSLGRVGRTVLGEPPSVSRRMIPDGLFFFPFSVPSSQWGGNRRGCSRNRLTGTVRPTYVEAGVECRSTFDPKEGRFFSALHKPRPPESPPDRLRRG